MNTSLHPDDLLARIRRRLRVREVVHRILVDLTAGISVLAGLALLDIWVPVSHAAAVAGFVLACVTVHLGIWRGRRYPGTPDAAGYLDRVYGLAEEFLAHVSPAAGRSALRGAAEAHLLAGLHHAGRMPRFPRLWVQANAWVFLPLTVLLSILCVRPLAGMVQTSPPTLFDEAQSMPQMHTLFLDPAEKDLQNLDGDSTIQDAPPDMMPPPPDAPALVEVEEDGAEGGAGDAEAEAVFAEADGEAEGLSVIFAEEDENPMHRFRQHGILPEREPPLRVRHQAQYYLVRLETLQ